MAPLLISQLLKVYALPLLFLAIITRLLRNKFKPILCDIPGPTLAGYTRIWRLVDVWKGDAHHTAINLHRKYGPLVRIGPNIVSVADSREISNIYGVNMGFTKTAFYPIQSIIWQKKPQMNLFSTRDEQYHRDQKRPIANSYSLQSLLLKEDAVDSCTTLLMHRLDEFANRDEPVDLGTWLQYYAFDVVGELSFALKFGFLEQGKDVDGMMEAIKGILVYASRCGQIPEAHPYLLGNPIFPILLPQMENWNEVLNFTLKAVNAVTGDQAHLNRNDELDVTALETQGDMLSQWSAIRVKSPEKMSTRDIITHLSANVFAGADTTTIELRAIVYFLIKNPDKMQKLLREIDEADREGNLSHPISYKESTTHLPYLNAVTKEAMRLHPSVGLLLERHVPPSGAKICGVQMPAGTIVGINAWVTQRDPNVFPDPESFIPERWLEASEDQMRKMDQAFLAFGAGSRTCIGRYVSLMMMAKVIPQLLREFEVRLTRPHEEWKCRNIWFVKQEGLICTLTRRRRV